MTCGFKVGGVPRPRTCNAPSPWLCLVGAPPRHRLGCTHYRLAAALPASDPGSLDGQVSDEVEGFALFVVPLLQAMPRGQTVAPWACLQPSLQNVQVAQSQVVHQLCPPTHNRHAVIM